ncbi:hypothetical protein GCM10011491_20590 [Brucella endophytica]|uniref:Uncharacterized protein n=1 Tax=Brucella endophytica TaxID=1963359 RepID=A0A916SCC2_9HYPH|nr:hypothetical protein [Brucella endophytica]GGA92459.1 hypothetical protein GCM10011491_20590 [Brucella endophytica]
MAGATATFGLGLASSAFPKFGTCFSKPDSSGRFPSDAAHQPAAPSATIARSALPDPIPDELLDERLFLAMKLYPLIPA